jgi:hypothetical protein
MITHEKKVKRNIQLQLRIVKRQREVLSRPMQIVTTTLSENLPIRNRYWKWVLTIGRAPLRSAYNSNLV